MSTETDLAQLHSIIVASIKTQFPDLVTVEFYREEREPLSADELPACLLDLSEMENEQEQDPGTGQLAVRCHFEAELIVPFKALRSRLSVRILAASFAAYLREQSRWPGIQQAGAMEVLTAHKSDFHPVRDQYEVWCVQWRQILHLGASMWDDEGSQPDVVMLGLDPDIGIGHEQDYEQIVP